MRNREPRLTPAPEAAPRPAVILRRAGATPRPVEIEKKLQADVAAWLKERRNSR